MYCMCRRAESGRIMGRTLLLLPSPYSTVVGSTCVSAISGIRLSVAIAHGTAHFFSVFYTVFYFNLWTFDPQIPSHLTPLPLILHHHTYSTIARPGEVDPLGSGVAVLCWGSNVLGAALRTSDTHPRIQHASSHTYARCALHACDTAILDGAVPDLYLGTLAHAAPRKGQGRVKEGSRRGASALASSLASALAPAHHHRRPLPPTVPATPP